MDSIVTVTMLSDKCQKCKYVDICDEKRMMACMVMKHISENPLITESAMAPLSIPLAAPIARKHTPVTINMGEYGKIDTSLERLKEQMEKDFYKNLNCNFSFGRR